MKDLKFYNQRGASMACDLVDVVRCRDCEYWMKKPDGVRGACLLLSKLIDREEITGCNEFCFSGTKKGVKMEWISVKDRLPEPHTDVLIWGAMVPLLGGTATRARCGAVMTTARSGMSPTGCRCLMRRRW